MPRELRISYPGAVYHIISRGNEKKKIFKRIFDRKKFLRYLASQHIKHKIIVHAYCLMDNHYHILMETPLPNISIVMQELQGSYAMYFNTKYKRVGHLFQGRYKAKVVEVEKYLRQCSRYIHRNPSGRNKDYLENYKWSSYQYYVTNKKPPKWLMLNQTLELFGERKSQQIRNYREYVDQRIDDDEFIKLLERGSCIGSKIFKVWLKGV